MSRQNSSPWLFIVLTLVSVAGLTVIAENWWRARARAAEKDVVIDSVATVSARLEVLLSQQLYILNGVASHIGFDPNISQDDFSKYVSNFLPQDSVVSVVAAAPAPALEISRIYPLADNEVVLGHSYRRSPEQKHAALLAIEQKGLVLAGPLKLVQGGTGFVARVPAFTSEDEQNTKPTKLWGLVAAVIRSETLYEEAGLLSNELGMEVALRGIDGSGPSGPIFFGREEIFDPELKAVKKLIAVGNGEWQIAAVPPGGWKTAASPIVWLIRIFGLITDLRKP